MSYEEDDKFFSPLLAGRHGGSPQLTQQQQPSPLRIQPLSSIEPQPQSPELSAYPKDDEYDDNFETSFPYNQPPPSSTLSQEETLYHSSMFRPPSPLHFNNNSSTNVAAQNQKHVFSVFNSNNNMTETTDPIFRHPSSSSSPTPHDQDSIKSNSIQKHNKQPSQTFNDSSPPTPSNNSAYNIHRDSHSNTFTSLTGPPLAGQANTLINPEVRPLKSITSLEQVYKMKFFDEKKPTWKFWILLLLLLLIVLAVVIPVVILTLNKNSSVSSNFDGSDSSSSSSSSSSPSSSSSTSTSSTSSTSLIDTATTTSLAATTTPAATTPTDPAATTPTDTVAPTPTPAPPASPPAVTVTPPTTPDTPAPSPPAPPSDTPAPAPPAPPSDTPAPAPAPAPPSDTPAPAPPPPSDTPVPAPPDTPAPASSDN